MHAVRNIRLCTKDCLCLYVCPTGATDTETGQIDPEKCLSGCRACVDACPSHAISLVPESYPEQQAKDDDVKKSIGQLSKSKVLQENIAHQLASTAKSANQRTLMKAIEKSNRIMAEDLLREAGFMLPQSQEVALFLVDLLSDEDLEQSAVDILRQLLKIIDPKGTIAPIITKHFRCGVCGYIHEGDIPEGFTCPVCKQSGDVFEAVVK